MAIVKRTLLMVLAACSAFAADSSLLSLVSPDTKVIAGLRVDRATSSQFGQFLLNQARHGDADFNKFVAATGFDPRRDLTEVIAASVDGNDKGHGLVVAHGVFDISKLLAQAKLHNASITNYKDVQVVTGSKTDGGWVAFLDGRTAAAGDPDAVKAAIDRRGSGVGIDSKLAAKVTEVSSKYDAWMVSIAPMSKFAGKLPNPQMNGALNGDMVQGIEQASGGVLFGSTIQLAGEAVTRSAKDATALVDVVKFLAGMVQLNRDKPDTAKLATILDTLVLNASANTMTISLSIPESDLEQLIKPTNRARVRRASVQK
jgi:hypothetical protein